MSEEPFLRACTQTTGTGPYHLESLHGDDVSGEVRYVVYDSTLSPSEDSIVFESGLGYFEGGMLSRAEISGSSSEDQPVNWGQGMKSVCMSPHPGGNKRDLNHGPPLPYAVSLYARKGWRKFESKRLSERAVTTT